MAKELTLRLPTKKDLGRLRRNFAARVLGHKSFEELAQIFSNNLQLGIFDGVGNKDARFVHYHNVAIWVYVSTRVIADNAIRLATDGVKVEREYYKNGLRKVERVEPSHPAAMLVERPNPRDTFPELVEEMFVNEVLTGMVFGKKEFDIRPREIWPLRSTRMTILPGKKTKADKRPDYYAGFVLDANRGANAQVFPPDKIMYLKRANPNNEYYGMSCFYSTRNSIMTLLSAQLYNKRYFDNNATPDSYLRTDFRFKDADEAQAWGKVWFDFYGGGENWHKTAVLGNGLELRTLTPTHKDMMFGELMKQLRDEISAAAGVPSIYLNDTDKANYANLRAHEQLLWRRTMLPLVGKFRARWNRDIF